MPQTQVEIAISKISEVLAQLSSGSRASTSDCKGLQLAPFDENNETFDSYIQRVENYLEIRNLKDDTTENDKKCVQIFINCLGPKLFHTLTCLTAPELPKEKKYKELVDLLKTHIAPKHSEVAEQHKFALRLQHEGEGIANFQADLKKMASNCNFTCQHCKKSTMSTHLRAQFIRGIRDDDIRERLLQQDASTTFEQTVKLALQIQASKEESREMKGPSLNAINKIHKSNTKLTRQRGSGTGQRTPDKQGRNKAQEKRQIKGKCYRCGRTGHFANKCFARDLKCSNCNRRGHVRSVCMKSQNIEQKIIDRETDQRESEDEYLVHCIHQNNIGKIFRVDVINGVKIKMEFDTGAAVSTISEKTFKKHLKFLPLRKTTVRLKTYTGEVMHPLGMATVKIECDGNSTTGNLYVLGQDVQPILGREWINRLGLLKAPILQISAEDISETSCKQILNTLLLKNKDLFTEEIGMVPSIKCSLELEDRNTKPIFLKPRPVPYALREKIEEELERLQKAKIIERVDYSPWGTPIVPVVKKSGEIRLCADYKATLNKVLKDDKYPIPRIEDIFAKMGGGKYFCVLDLHKAYLHLQVDDESAFLQSISTHKGTFKVNRLMFGVKVSPNAWQRLMDNILQDLPGVLCYFDDILVQGSSYTQLLTNLSKTFQRLKNNNLHLNRGKCQFLLNSIKYLGHVIDNHGIKPIPERIEAITKSKPPENVAELRTFLGLINYYQKFIPNLSSKLAPLNNLLKKDVKYVWNQRCETTFANLKNEITSTTTLVKYDPNLPLVLATDASPSGLGAVISHVMPNGEERPIAFASRSLSSAERNYTQLDKEATSIYWGLRKFFQYCYGRKFTLLTDHKPLTRILHQNKELPHTSALRLLHYASFMSGFNYDIKYRNTKLHANADYLSRFPVEAPDIKKPDSESIAVMHQIEMLPVTRDEIRKLTIKDSECLQYYRALQTGKPLPFGEQLSDFSLQDGCILRGIRIMIPKPLRKRILDELHTAHVGIVRMKALARNYVWWRGIDQDIEKLSRQCRSCALNRPNPTKVSPHPWECPKEPWQRLHIDYAGPFMNTNFLIVVDAHSKWLEVSPQASISTYKTIETLRELFARFGLPTLVVTDNGSQFKSFEFQRFLKTNGIAHRTTAPYHPSTNGQAERFVQIVKQGLRAMKNEQGTLNEKLSRLLMQYRKTPNSVTGTSPAEIMFNRSLRTRLDLITRDIRRDVEQTRDQERDRVPSFNIGDKVQIRMYSNKSLKWKFGIIWAKRGYLHYEVLVENEKHLRHVEQIRKTDCEPFNERLSYEPPDVTTTAPSQTRSPNTGTFDTPLTVLTDTDNYKSNEESLPDPQVAPSKSTPDPAEKTPEPEDLPSPSTNEQDNTGKLRRSVRHHRKPDRLTYTSFSSRGGRC